jgi:PPOX class probable FMN-dependent enzyme
VNPPRSLERFGEIVRSGAELTDIVGTPSPGSLKKELTALDRHMRRFIAHAPFLVISTHSADGRCDASPRGDAPGFVHVVDDRTLVIPDRRGNRRLDSLRNIVETGHIGLLFLVPAFGETLRVNGRAAIVRDEACLTPLSAQGKRPLLAIAVDVQDCYLQCAKALIRSKLWEPHQAPSPEDLPCAARMLVDQCGMSELDVPAMQAALDEAYRNNLY